MRLRSLFVTLLLFSCVDFVAAAAAATLSVAAGDYQRLQKWRFAATGTAVPAAGITFNRDTCSWTLQSGTVRLMEPLSDGSVTGLVFEGKGRFVMTIPDRFEVEQLRRFSRKPGIEMVDVPFSRLVLRSSGKTPEFLFDGKAVGNYASCDIAADRHKKWLRVNDLDADAQVVAARAVPGDDYLLVDMDSADFGWLMYEYDPFRTEEIRLLKLQRMNDYPEIWVSLDRPQERDASGRPGQTEKQLIDLTAADIQVDLSDTSKKTFDLESPDREWVHFSVRIAFIPLVDGARAIRIELAPQARVKSVADGDGALLPFLRDETGKRFADMNNELSNSSLVVLLDQPTRQGMSQEMLFEYDMKLYSYASGRSWYPGESGSLSDRHTGKLAFIMPDGYHVRAVGVPGEEKRTGRGTEVTWTVDRPMKMFGYAFGKGFKEEKIVVSGLPEIVSFGMESGFTTGNMVRNVAADIANSMNFYQQYFAVKLPAERIYATRILGYHGQAFDGFIHFSHLTYDSEHPGASELFRAHETAHQYWGHLVGWKSYRDQWLSEAFAEYSAMLFLRVSRKNDKVFDEVLSVYTDEQTGSVKNSGSIFFQAWDGVRIPSFVRSQIGPIAAGFRASTAEAPFAYSMQAYHKGALVLHMIRQILGAVSHSRDLFRETLQDFLSTYAGKSAGTEDFMVMLNKHSNIDWRPFFDNWVYGTAVPAYEWDWSVSRSATIGEEYLLTLNVKQTRVPPGFSARVPVRIEFPSRKVGTLWLTIDAAEKTFSQKLPQKPDKVIFNPDFSILARVKRK